MAVAQRRKRNGSVERVFADGVQEGVGLVVLNPGELFAENNPVLARQGLKCRRSSRKIVR